MGNIIVWADIPVIDLDRASKFYSHVLGMPVGPMPGTGGVALPQAPPDADAAAGASMVAFDLYVGGAPSTEGTTIYLASMGDIPGMMTRVREAGGEVLQEPQNMGPMIGTLAFIKDTEGNRIGIHEQPAGM